MSPAHRFHPEFGYFCPSPSLRRKLRIALACIVIGVLAGASGALVLKAAHDPEPSRLMVVRTDEAAVSAEAAPAAGEAVVTPSVVTPAVIRPSVAMPAPERERPRPPEVNGQAACEQDAPASQTWAYLDGKCVSGRPRKARAARPPASGSAATAAPSGRDAKSATNTGPAAAVAATTQPAEQGAAAPKKPQKPPRSQSASREQAGGRTSAAPDDRAVWHSPFERGPFNFFR
ncbi:MAG: hypothetical protein ABWY47_01455 [Xanthobacteraceae bacterium]|jgi:hypothetical protein